MCNKISPRREDKYPVSGDLEVTANLSRDSQQEQAVFASSCSSLSSGTPETLTSGSCHQAEEQPQDLHALCSQL
jgi:hypothetical protein